MNRSAMKEFRISAGRYRGELNAETASLMLTIRRKVHSRRAARGETKIIRETRETPFRHRLLKLRMFKCFLKIS